MIKEAASTCGVPAGRRAIKLSAAHYRGNLLTGTFRKTTDIVNEIVLEDDKHPEGNFSTSNASIPSQWVYWTPRRFIYALTILRIPQAYWPIGEGRIQPP